MRTIVDGSSDILNKVKYFKCNACGWIGAADKDEYTHETWRNEDYYLINCPFCNGTVYAIESNREIDEIKKMEIKGGF